MATLDEIQALPAKSFPRLGQASDDLNWYLVAAGELGSTAEKLRIDLGVNKLDATEEPDNNDDSDSGYAVGSLWIDVTADEAYRCLDAAVGAAEWVNTTMDAADTIGWVA